MNSIKILLWNARNYGNKKEEAGYKFQQYDIGIGIITEIKNSSNVFKNRFNNFSISGYHSVVVNNYKNGQGGAGGVAILVKKEMDV